MSDFWTIVQGVCAAVGSLTVVGSVIVAIVKAVTKKNRPFPFTRNQIWEASIGGIAIFAIAGVFFLAGHPDFFSSIGSTLPASPTLSPTRTGTTPTSVPTDTPTPQPSAAEHTPTDPQKLYDQVMSDTPVFDDHLTHQDALKWAEGRQCSFTQGSYHAYDPYRSPPHAIECLAQTSNFSANFAFQATMTIVRGDRGGLLIGYGSTNSRKYRFAIDQNGDYDLFAPELGRSLVSGSSPLIKQGLNQLNVLTVIVKGNIIYLYIQGKYVNQTTVLSGTSVSGKIGLFSDLQKSSTSPTEVVFSDAEVWTLSEL